MKKIVAIIIFILFLLVMPFSTYAADDSSGDVSVEDTVVTPEVSEDSEKSDIESVTSTPFEPDIDASVEEKKETDKVLTDEIEQFFERYGVEIGKFITIIAGLFTLLKKCKTLIKSARTMNDNTIKISEENAVIMSRARDTVQVVSDALVNYENQISAIIGKYEKSEQENELLREILLNVNDNFKTFSEANIEFSNELAELLGLANIPNYKKEEIGARHLAAVKSIKAATKKIDAVALATPEEVTENDGEITDNKILDA